MRAFFISSMLASMLPLSALAVTVTDGSFEDPAIFPTTFTQDEFSPFTFWDNSGVGFIGLGSVSAFAGTVVPPTLDGSDQWAYMRDNLGVSQRIGTVTDSTDHIFEFAQGGQDNIGDNTGDVSISIFAGDPLVAGILLDSETFPAVGGAGRAEAVLRTATLLTGVGNEGLDLYLQLAHAGVGSNVLIDSVSVGVVPLPAGAILFASGLLVFGFFRRSSTKAV